MDPSASDVAGSYADFWPCATAPLLFALGFYNAVQLVTDGRLIRYKQHIMLDGEKDLE